MAGRTADRDAECRRSARARRGEAAAAHAWRTELGLVRGLWRAVGLERGDASGDTMLSLWRARTQARHRVLRRDALCDGPDRTHAGRGRSVRVDRHLRRG